MNDIISIILGILAFILAFAIMVGFVLLPYTLIEWLIFKYKKGEYLRQLSIVINSQIDASFWMIFRNSSASLKGEWDGKKIEVKLYYRLRFMRYESPQIEICLYHIFPCQVSICRKDFPPDFLMTEFYFREEKISTGDLQFDKNYEILSDSELNAKTFLTLKRREIIQRLFTQKNIKSVSIYASYVKITFKSFSGSKKFENILSSTEFPEVLIDIKRLTDELEDSK
ncbi:MAG: hypothetical protein CVT88_07115 [Candidatus Altiarchaeales archaeon HGW-Altiarchaeales-1]|nr:MAG: hypothetical protein CVT88_07115 [Candidatus Altiarchaeales archaeon HGW-Altiarchaeales-1]